MAVRAIAPVAGSPPTIGDTMLAIPCAKSSTLELWRLTAHPVGDDGRQQRLDGAEHRHGQRRRQQRQNQIRDESAESARLAVRPECRRTVMPIVSSGNWATATTIGAGDERNDVSGHARNEPIPDDDERSSTPMPTAVVGIEALPTFSISTRDSPDELARHRPVERDPEDVAQLRAGDHERDAVGEPDDDRTRNEADGRAVPVRPMTTSTTPAIIVHMNRPSRPCSAMMPDTTTTNAPVGPPICT